MTIDLNAIHRRHACGLDSAASSHLDRGELLAEVERLLSVAADQAERTRAYEDGYAAGKAAGIEEERSRVADYLRARADGYAQKSAAFSFATRNHLPEIARVLGLHADAICDGQHEKEMP